MRFDEILDAVLVRLYREGATRAEMAAELDCSPRTAGRRLRRLGVGPRPQDLWGNGAAGWCDACPGAGPRCTGRKRKGSGLCSQCRGGPQRERPEEDTHPAVRDRIAALAERAAAGLPLFEGALASSPFGEGD